MRRSEILVGLSILMMVAPASARAHHRYFHHRHFPAGRHRARLSTAQPDISARAAPVLTIHGLQFKDLNKNGRLDAYEDWRLPVSRRIADLIRRMTLAEKAGLMMHAAHTGFQGPGGAVLDTLAPPPPGALKSPVNVAGVPGFDRADKPNSHDLILQKNVRWISTAPGGTPGDTARWTNALQAIAEGSRLGIPIIMSADPVETTNRMPGGALPPPDRRKITSSWPDQIGLAAADDPQLVTTFAHIARDEYRALGFRMVINPMADVTTEPRWNRIPGTFGEDADQVANDVRDYVLGFQGDKIGPTSVLTVVKHFPGDGPVEDGLDPHQAYGRFLVYPTHNLDYHLKPFEAGIAAGTSDVMPGYGIPTGIDTVGNNFSKKIVTGLLRQRLHFKGIVLSDWLHAMPWGVETDSKEQREKLMLQAGVDQFGGEHEPSYILDLVHTHQVSEKRLDQSVRRILKPMFELGMFENPYVDPAQADKIVAGPDFTAAGNAAQREAVVVLKDRSAILPLGKGQTVFLSGFDKAPTALASRLASTMQTADVIIVKVNAPYTVHKGADAFFKGTHEGPLVFAGSDNAGDLEAIKTATSTGKPVVVVMSMERPAVLSEFIDTVDGMVATFGSGDDAVADILTGAFRPSGKLPFDLPADEASVGAQKEDAPHDFEHTLFKSGFGLTYPAY